MKRTTILLLVYKELKKKKTIEKGCLPFNIMGHICITYLMVFILFFDCSEALENIQMSIQTQFYYISFRNEPFKNHYFHCSKF